MFQKTILSRFARRDIKLLIFIASFLSAFQVYAALNSNSTVSKRNHIEYGIEASSRIAEWRVLLQTARFLTEKEKLTMVNDFFNQNITFANDFKLWGKHDYWATPLEILSKGAGDCEDYSIAKYFTLKKLGVSEKKLRITYVKDLNRNSAHMILTYTSSPNDTPLILDNVDPELTMASMRKDLSPLYSFNDTGLWLAKFNRKSKRVGSSSQLNMWTELTKRMEKNSLKSVDT